MKTHNVVSDQDIYCLLTEVLMKFGKKKYHSLSWKWTRHTEMGRLLVSLFHLNGLSTHNSKNTQKYAYYSEREDLLGKIQEVFSPIKRLQTVSIIWGKNISFQKQ